METYIGTDQTEYGSPLGVTGETKTEPPLLACSDQYLEFVRQKKIEVITGRLAQASGDSMTISNISGEDETIDDIAAIVCATGFDASPSIDFLPSDVLETLDFDATDDGFPLALNVHTTISKAIPTLGFVGFYRSPYWGVMEMQARFLAKLWTGITKAKKVLDGDTTMQTMMKLRKDPKRAQFPMGDYAYLMESFAEILGGYRHCNRHKNFKKTHQTDNQTDIQRYEPPSSPEGARTGVITPYRYTYSCVSPAQNTETKLALGEHYSTFHASSQKAKFVPRAVFRGLQGIWTLHRTITSRISTFPSGTLTGTATLFPRNPTDAPPKAANKASPIDSTPQTPTLSTASGRSCSRPNTASSSASLEYLYFEEGQFLTSFGATMNAKRSYVYRYFEEKDCIDLWFAKQDYLTADYFFHRVEFIVPDQGVESKMRSTKKGWKAVSSHLCEFIFVEDLVSGGY